MTSQITFQHPQKGGKGLLDKQAVSIFLGISIRTIDNLVKANEFPAGVRLGRFLFWSEAVVEMWRAQLFAAQESWRR